MKNNILAKKLASKRKKEEQTEAGGADSLVTPRDR
jgi:hypothetical protein